MFQTDQAHAELDEGAGGVIEDTIDGEAVEESEGSGSVLKVNTKSLKV